MVRYLFDTCVVIDYLRDQQSLAADALVVAANRGLVSVITLLELQLYDDSGKINTKSKARIKKELQAVSELCNTYGVQIIPISRQAQIYACSILEKFRQDLGRNALSDSLIMGTGMARRATLVTSESAWFRIAKSPEAPSFFKVILPEKLVEVG